MPVASDFYMVDYYAGVADMRDKMKEVKQLKALVVQEGIKDFADKLGMMFCPTCGDSDYKKRFYPDIENICRKEICINKQPMDAPRIIFQCNHCGCIWTWEEEDNEQI